MSWYLIYFNQQCVGHRPDEWYDSREVLARAVVLEMKGAGVLVFAGGLVEEIETTITADANSGSLAISSGRYIETQEFLEGMTIFDVQSEEQARMWVGKIAVACGWPQEVRRFTTKVQAYKTGAVKILCEHHLSKWVKAPE